MSRIRKLLLMAYLAKNRVDYATLPDFLGRWPRFLNKGRISLGRHCWFREFRSRHHFAAVTEKASIEIGNGCHFNDGVNVCAARRIVIENYSGLGENVTVYDTLFHEVQEHDPVKTADVVIGRNVWVGAGSFIMPGVTIGAHSMIGAGSVVTKDIPSKVVAAGNPAKVRKTIDCQDDWI
jgi:acetyltransferase-like isoleucine patch superfamily enzyme